MTPTSFPLSDDALRVGLALFHAVRAGADTSTLALASRAGMSVDAVAAAIRPLAMAGLIEPLGLSPGVTVSLDDPATIRNNVMFGMTALLPLALAGQLDYSPANDDERVAAIRDAHAMGAEPLDDDTLAARLGIPAVRVREAIDRLVRRGEQTGVRMRIILEVTFPDAVPEHFSGVLRRWTDMLEANDVVRCRKAVLREATGIGFTHDPGEYQDWRVQRGAYDPGPPGGPGLGGLF